MFMWELSHSTITLPAADLSAARAAVKAVHAREDVGFLKLLERPLLWSTSEARARELRRSFSRLIVLGMGGSSLGGRALIQALTRFGNAHTVEFIDNVDSERFWRWLRHQNDLNSTHWLIISKSGNTIETLTTAEFLDQHLRLSGFKKLAAQSTVISENEDNPLTRWARKENVPCLEIPKDVGGRYSVLTPVGLLPAAFYGLSLEQMQDGMKWAIAAEDLAAQLTAQALASFKREKWITQFWSYADGLRDFGFWTQQLWAESLGKAQDLDGKPAPRVSTPMAAVGTSDQHSILQQVIEGSRDKFLWFFRVQQSESDGPTLERGLFDNQGQLIGKTMGDLFAAEATGTRDALRERGVDSLTLQTANLNEASLSALFILMETVVASIGQALNINAFDQPGVELGKKLAREILKG
jgi:glucose-6-phosphate isomerase